MNGLRFKVGELARVAVDIFCEGHDGEVVEILVVGPMWDGRRERWNDYVVSDPRGDGELYAMDIELKRLDPPAEPESIMRREEVEA